MSYFSTIFKKQLTPQSTYKYIFSTHNQLTNQNERLAFEKISVQITQDEFQEGILPDEFENPMILKGIFNQWLLDCSGCFVKLPTFEKFKYSSELVPYYESDTKLSVSHWFPTRIELDMPNFKIYWMITHKTIQTPVLPDKIQIDDDVPDIQIDAHTYIQQPDGTRFIKTNEGVRTEWLQELSDSALPLSDLPALRLEVDIDEAQREKFRRRVRDARIRAKLARYRSERLALRYEERFGIYPDEDAEEAQTEAEKSDDE